MRVAILVVSLAACAGPTQSVPTPLIAKFETISNESTPHQEVLWVLYNGRLARCWYTVDKGPVCMVPPVIKMPPTPWLKTGTAIPSYTE